MLTCEHQAQTMLWKRETKNTSGKPARFPCCSISQSTTIDLNFVSILIAKQRVTSQCQFPSPCLYSVSFICFPSSLFVFLSRIIYSSLFCFPFRIISLGPLIFFRSDNYFLVRFFFHFVLFVSWINFVPSRSLSPERVFAMFFVCANFCTVGWSDHSARGWCVTQWPRDDSKVAMTSSDHINKSVLVLLLLSTVTLILKVTIFR